MPKDGKQRYFAVRHGKAGCRLYVKWEEAKDNAWDCPGATQKTFTDIGAAQDWLYGAQHVQKEAAHSTAMDDMMIIDEPAAGPSCLTLASPFDPGNILTENSVINAPSAKPKLAPLPEQTTLTLSAEQHAILDMVKEGRNVFFTGSAGTGKSVLLREIIKLRDGPRSSRLGVTASTGIASVNIGGQTLHSWAGIGLGKGPAEMLAKKLLGQDKHLREQEAEQRRRIAKKYGMRPENVTLETDTTRVADRWRDVRTLIIDEISMIDGELFDKLEYIARFLRGNTHPFGGIQLVVSGDFFQLPPVPETINGAKIKSRFAFQARSWHRCLGPPVELKHVFRQKDKAFVSILNEMRFGHLDRASTATLNSLSRPLKCPNGIEPTELFPTRREVQTANDTRLDRLPGREVRYDAIDAPGLDKDGNELPPERVWPRLEELIAPQSITLKVGAQVMLVKNLIQGQLVNGSLGRVIGFRTVRDALRDGTTLEIEGQIVQEVDQHKIPSRILEREEELPIVQFLNGYEILCVQSTFESVNFRGDIEAIREQIPLILAWALSIHKSQGQTLELVRVDLTRTFEKGQAYVALSRATSMEGLQVVNFAPAKIRAHPDALEWYRKLARPYVPPDEVDEQLDYWWDLAT